MKKFCIFLLLISILFCSCDGIFNSTGSAKGDTGAITINLAKEEFAARTVNAEGAKSFLDVERWNVTFVPAANSAISDPIVRDVSLNNSSCSFTLLPATYDVTLKGTYEAYDENNNPYCLNYVGSTTVTVKAGENAPVTVYVGLQKEAGDKSSLSYTVAFENSTFFSQSPKFLVYLENLSGGEGFEFNSEEFYGFQQVGSNTSSMAYSYSENALEIFLADLPSAFYRMTIYYVDWQGNKYKMILPDDVIEIAQGAVTKVDDALSPGSIAVRTYYATTETATGNGLTEAYPINIHELIEMLVKENQTSEVTIYCDSTPSAQDTASLNLLNGHVLITDPDDGFVELRDNAVKYSITYDLDDGSFETTPESFYTSAGIAQLPVPTREGYLFGGWFLSNIYSGIEVTSVAANENRPLKLCAYWTKLNEYLESFPAGSEVELSGTYLLGSTIYITKELTLIGSDDCTIKRMENFYGSSPMITVSGGGTLTLKNITLDGNGENVSTTIDNGTAISVSNTGGKVILDSSHIVNHVSNGSVVYFPYASDGSIYYFEMKNNSSIKNNKAIVPSTSSAMIFTNGAGLHIGNVNMEVKISDSEISGNIVDSSKITNGTVATQVEGVGLWLGNKSIVSITDTKFGGNTVNQRSGTTRIFGTDIYAQDQGGDLKFSIGGAITTTDTGTGAAVDFGLGIFRLKDFIPIKVTKSIESSSQIKMALEYDPSNDEYAEDIYYHLFTPVGDDGITPRYFTSTEFMKFILPGENYSLSTDGALTVN